MFLLNRSPNCALVNREGIQVIKSLLGLVLLFSPAFTAFIVLLQCYIPIDRLMMVALAACVSLPHTHTHTQTHTHAHTHTIKQRVPTGLPSIISPIGALLSLHPLSLPKPPPPFCPWRLFESSPCFCFARIFFLVLVVCVCVSVCV